MLLFKATRILIADFCLNLIFDHITKNLGIGPKGGVDGLYSLYVEYTRLTDIYYGGRQDRLTYDEYRISYELFSKGMLTVASTIFSEESLKTYIQEITADLIALGRNPGTP